MNRAATIAVASGKGGTGKTTVAAHLALAFSRSQKTMLLDLDVEAPDALGYFPAARALAPPQTVTVSVPWLAHERCDGCGRCAKVCRFGAIVVIGGIATMDDAVCKGCGRCAAACPACALSERDVNVGTTSRYASGYLEIFEGRLAVGDIRATAVIEAVKDRSDAPAEAEIQVRDCPPGVSCPAAHALEGADFAVLVAEPTAFSLHDVSAAIRLAKGQGIPAGILINKDGFGDADIDVFAARHGVPVIGRIRFSRKRAQAGAQGRLWEHDPEALGEFDRVAKRLASIVPSRKCS